MRTFAAKPLILLLLATLLGVAACGQPEVRFQSEGFPFEVILESGVATGGLVLNDRLVFEDTDMAESPDWISGPYGEADHWSHHLETACLLQAPELNRWAWPTVADQVDSTVMTELFQAYKRGSILKEQPLLRLGAELPATRFLLLARIDENDLSLHSNGAVSPPINEETSGLGKVWVPQDPQPLERRGYSQRRTVRVSMELYNLETGRSVWSASVSKNSDRMLDGSSGAEPPAVRVSRDPDAESGIQILGHGGLSGGPTLEELLPDACEALVAELMAQVRLASENARSE
jgi:hypothetical protein